MLSLSKSLKLISSLRLVQLPRYQFAKEKNKEPEQDEDEEEFQEETKEVAKSEADLKREARAKYIASRLIKQRDRFATDSEQHRIDIGLLISRSPIYMYISEEERAFQKYRYETATKYKYIMPQAKDAMDFKRHLPVHNLSGIEVDNTPTHRIKHEDGTATSYSVNANYFTHVDPNINDNHSIQHAAGNRCYFLVKEKESGNWAFPQLALLDKIPFVDGRVQLFAKLSEGKWDIAHGELYPEVVTKRSLTDTERKDVRHKRIKGVKTYYFDARFFKGTMGINKELYDDYAWVTRLELNKYFDRDQYDTFVNFMHNY